MSNWTSITEAIIRTAKNTALLDAMQGLADSRGESDPLPAIIRKAVARIRSSVSAGNVLDSDTTKIPNSLEWLAVNLIIRGIKSYLEVELSKAEEIEARDDSSYLNRMVDALLKFETADDAAGSAEMNSAQPQVETITDGNTGSSREDMKGL